MSPEPRMADLPLSQRAFARRLSRLPRRERTEFVADLWRLRGWETAVVAGGHVVARDGDAKRRLYVCREGWLRSDDAPTTDPAVDVVVTTSEAANGAAERADRLDATLVAAGDLYEMVLYAVDRTAAKALLWDYVGAGTREGPAGVDRAVAGLLGGLAVVLCVVLVLVASGAGPLSTAPGPVSDGTASGAVEATAGEDAIGTSSRSTEVLSAVGAGATDRARTVTESTVATSCERGPGQIVSTVVWFLRTSDPSTNARLSNAWRFLSSPGRESFGDFAGFVDAMDTPKYAPLVSATHVTYGRLNRAGDTAVRSVSVTSPAGNATYRFPLSVTTFHRGEKCWRIDPIRLDGSGQ